MNDWKQHPLFLRWAFFESLAIVILIALSLAGFASGVSGAPLAVSAVILTVATVVSGYAGYLSWRADNVLASWEGRVNGARDILHDASHIFHAIWLCQVLGLIGALMGYRQETETAATATDVTTAIHSVFQGLGNGLTATLVGILCSLLFFAQSRLLEQALAKYDR